MMDPNEYNDHTLKLLRQLARTKDRPEEDSLSNSAHPMPIWLGAESTKPDFGFNADPTAKAELLHRLPGEGSSFSRRAVLIGLASCTALAALILLISYGDTGHRVEGTVVQTPPTSLPVPTSTTTALLAARSSADLDSVQRAMAHCDREAAQNAQAIYILVLPIRPNTDAARINIPAGEHYGTFYLMTSQTALQALKDGSYVISTWPFRIAISDTASEEVQVWTLVSGLTELNRKDAGGFMKFRLGFDPAGENQGLKWSNEYVREPGTCYWINVQFRGR